MPVTAFIALSPIVHHPKHFDRCHGLKGKQHWGCRTHWHRKPSTPPATNEAVASWYDDAEGTACGTHYSQGVANKTLPCGTTVRLCHIGCEEAVVEDRGPFVPGREFDLNPGAKAAIACSDICTVRWAVVR